MILEHLTIPFQDPMPDYMYERLADECVSPAAALAESPKAGVFYAAFIDDRFLYPTHFLLYVFLISAGSGLFVFVRRRLIRPLFVFIWHVYVYFLKYMMSLQFSRLTLARFIMYGQTACGA